MRTNRSVSKILSWALVAVLVFGVAPISLYAEDAATNGSLATTVADEELPSGEEEAIVTPDADATDQEETEQEGTEQVEQGQGIPDSEDLESDVTDPATQDTSEDESEPEASEPSEPSDPPVVSEVTAAEISPTLIDFTQDTFTVGDSQDMDALNVQMTANPETISGKTIKLNADVTGPLTIPAGVNSLTIQGNGNSLEGFILCQGDIDLTLEDLELTGSSGDPALTMEDGGELTMDGVDILGGENSECAFLYRGDLILNAIGSGNEIRGGYRDDNDEEASDGMSSATSSCDLIMNGDVDVAGGDAFISSDGLYHTGGTVTIASGSPTFEAGPNGGIGARVGDINIETDGSPRFIGGLPGLQANFLNISAGSPQFIGDRESGEGHSDGKGGGADIGVAIKTLIISGDADATFSGIGVCAALISGIGGNGGSATISTSGNVEFLGGDDEGLVLRRGVILDLSELTGRFYVGGYIYRSDLDGGLADAIIYPVGLAEDRKYNGSDPAYELDMGNSTPGTDAAPPSISRHPSDAAYTQNAPSTALAVTARSTDGGSLSYQWYSNTVDDVTGGTKLDGATLSRYTPDTTELGTTYYYVEVTNTNDSKNGIKVATTTSETAEITVYVSSPGLFNPGDIAVINSIVDNNWPDDDTKPALAPDDGSYIPSDWSFVRWSSGANGRRVTGLDFQSMNLVGSLDVSALTSLKYIYCSSNQLTELDVSGLNSLTTLRCEYNKLTKLDVSGCTALTLLWCYSNQLTELDVSGLNAIEDLSCFSNQLAELIVSGLNTLEYLSCSSNQITELDVSGLSNLTNLSCYSNQLTKLIVSGCSELAWLDCKDNQLTELDVTGLSINGSLNCTYNNMRSKSDVKGFTGKWSVVNFFDPQNGSGSVTPDPDPKPDPTPSRPYYPSDDDDDDDNDDDSSYSTPDRSRPATPAPSSPINVTTAAATTSVSNALEAAKLNGASTATANLKNPGSVTLEVLQAMARQAGSTTLKLNADSMNGLAVDVRVSLNPAQATIGLNLSGSTVNPVAVSVKNHFKKFFSNDLMTVALGQQGSFGMPVEIAVKLDPTIDTTNLVFYTYDSAKNLYSRIAAPAYWVDVNGYVHFKTSVGGSIVICEGDLVRR